MSFNNPNQARGRHPQVPTPATRRGFARKTPYRPSATARSAGQAGGRYKSGQPVRTPRGLATFMPPARLTGARTTPPEPPYQSQNPHKFCGRTKKTIEVAAYPHMYKYSEVEAWHWGFLQNAKDML